MRRLPRSVTSPRQHSTYEKPKKPAGGLTYHGAKH
jgi:hypothetical protein